MSTPETQLLHGIPAVQRALDVGRTTVMDLLASGELRSVKLGARRLVPHSELVAFVERLQSAVRGEQIA